MKAYITLLIFLASVLAAGAQSPGNITPEPRMAYVRLEYSVVFSLKSKKEIHLDPAHPDYIHAWEFNAEMRKRNLDTLKILLGNVSPQTFGIILGRAGNFINGFLDGVPDQKIAITTDYPGREGYIIDVMAMRAILGGCDSAGLHYAINTFFQLIDQNQSIFCSRIVDAPEFPVRWIYYPMNFLVGANTTKLKQVWSEAASYKLNGADVGDVKYDRIHTIEQRYIDSLVSVNKFAKARYFEFVPSIMSWGYSNSLMFFNPNYASGLPVKGQRFVIEGDSGRLAPEVPVSMPNGGFESYSGNNFTGFLYIDKPGEMSFADTDVKHSGNASVRFENFSNSNARVVYRTKVKPFTMYHISAWVKTDNLDANDVPHITPIGNKNPCLNYANINIPWNTDWKRCDVCINTLQSDTVGFYFGVWGANSGKIWWDDLQIEEIPFVNMIRREGAPIDVVRYTSGSGMTVFYGEGVDFDSLWDPKAGHLYSWSGEFDTYHQPPAFRIKPGGGIKNGDTVSISYYHTTTIYDGQVMVTMSDQALYDQIETELRVLDSILKPKTYFINHDEIRVMNWDKGDLDRGMTPGQLLADNVIKCCNMIHKYNPGADIWDWSDMFDEYHNAVKSNYYLVNGDLTGSADLIPNTLGIANWNSQSNKVQNSLGFFSGKGFRQISAPYYDAGVAQIRQWKEWTREVPNFMGMMYTTWANDYSKLREFAEYCWNHAPYVYHQPLYGVKPTGKQYFNMLITGDEEDDQWQAVNATLHYRTSSGSEFIEISTVPLTSTWVIALDLPKDNKWLQYYITATDNRGWTTRMPFGEGKYYELGDKQSGVDDDAREPVSVYPNPAISGSVITVKTDRPLQKISLSDLNGRLVYMQGPAEGVAENSFSLPEVSAGTYLLKVYTGNEVLTRKIVVVE